MLINDRLKLAAMDPNNVAIDDLKSMARELLADRSEAVKASDLRFEEPFLYEDLEAYNALEGDTHAK